MRPRESRVQWKGVVIESSTNKLVTKREPELGTDWERTQYTELDEEMGSKVVGRRAGKAEPKGLSLPSLAA